MENYIVGTPEFEDAYNKLLATWNKAYMITLRTHRQKQRRLNELLTWDKSKGLYDWEHIAKVTALQNLLNEDKHKPKKRSHE